MLKTAKCTCCESIYTVDMMVKVASPKRGNNSAYMCEHCATRNRSYHSQANKKLTVEKVNKVMCGIELETSFTNENARLQMFEYGFIPTADCSLSSDGNGSRYGYDSGNTCEYVSPIMYGLNQPSKLCVTVDNLMQEGSLKINNSCGTHFHVSIDSMKDSNGQYTYMDMVRRFYHSLFVPLTEAMQASPDKTVALFGRNFNGHYAKPINRYSDTWDRYLFINVKADNNIEFRLNKFVNAKQYQTLMKFEVDVVKTVITNFCEHFNEQPKDTRRYPDIKEYRLHKAQMTANKIVKLFEKYANNI